MASPLGDVLLKFRVNTAPLDQGLAKMQTKIDRLARHVSGLKFGPTTMFGNTGRSIDKLASAISKGIAGGISAGAKAGSNAFAKSIDEMERKHKRFAAGMEARGKRIISQGRRAYRSASKQKSDARAAMNAARNMPAYNRARAKFRDATWKQRNAKNFIAYGKSKQKTGARLEKTTPKIVMAGKAASAVFSVVAKGVGVLARLTGSIWGLINPFEKLGMLFDGLVNMTKGFVGLITTAAGKILQVGSLMAIGVIATGGYFVKLAGEEEAALTNIVRVAGLAKSSVKDLRSSLLSVSSRSGGVSVGEVNQIAEFGARMGVGSKAATEKGKVKEISDFAQSLSHVRIALDDIPVEEAATKISRILNVFQLGIDKTTNFASALVMLDNASTATGRDILEITRRLAGTGSAMGISVQETMALAAAMRDVGIDIEVGGTSIQNFFVRMSSDLANFSKQLKIPKQQLENLIDTKPMEAMRLVLSRLSQYSARDQAVLFTKLHLQGQRMTSTIWQLVKGFGKFDELLKGSRSNWESLESIETAVNMKSQILWSTMQKLWNQVNEIAIELGTRFIPVVQELVGLFGDVVVAAKKIIENNNFFEGQAKFITDYITMARVLMSSTTLATEFFNQKWTDVVAYAGQLFKWLRNMAKDAAIYLGESVGTIFGNLATVISDNVNIFVTIGEVIGAAINKGLKATVGNVWGDIVEAFWGPILGKDQAKLVADNAVRPNQMDDLALDDATEKLKADAGKAFSIDNLKKLGDGLRIPKSTLEIPKFTRSAEGDKVALKLAEETNKFNANRPGDISLKQPANAIEEAAVAKANFDRLSKKDKEKIPDPIKSKEGFERWLMASNEKIAEKIRKSTARTSGFNPNAPLKKSTRNEGESLDDFEKRRNREIAEQQDKKDSYYDMLRSHGVDRKANTIAAKQAVKIDASENAAKKIGSAVGVAIDNAILDNPKVTNEELTKVEAVTRKTIAEQAKAINLKGKNLLKLPDMRNTGYKPQFYGLEEFSKKIQSDIFDKKKNDPMENISNGINKMVTQQENWEKNQGKQMAEDVGALAQMGRNGQLFGGVLMA